MSAAAPIRRTTSRGVNQQRARRLESQASRLLARHPHFLGKSQFVKCRCEGRQLRLAGRLPSFFLKQLAQEALRGLVGIDHIDNQIVVASPTGEVWPPIRKHRD